MTVPTDLDRRFREAAVRADLLDAAYDVIDTEIGPLLAATTDRGLARQLWFDPDPEAHLEELARLAGQGVLRAPRALDETRRELDEYFTGRRTAFDLSLDLRGLPEFTVQGSSGELALESPTATPPTYHDLAIRVGNPPTPRARSAP